MAQGAGKPRLVTATILFIDLMDSVSLSNTLTLLEYNELISDYQAILRSTLDNIRKKYPVGEFYLGGDQLAVFFYAQEDAGLLEKIEDLRRRTPGSKRAAEIEARLDFSKSRCLYGALRCAVQVKNRWIRHGRNLARISAHQPVLDLGVGINTGHVIYQQRSDGQARIEGFAINFAKRVEGFSRFGNFCKIMLAKSSYETFRNTVVGHTMLKQRAAFERYVPGTGVLKGLSPGTVVFELKYFHRLAGFAIPDDQVSLYTQIFKMDSTNIWAYTNLMNYYLYERNEIDVAQELAQRAFYGNPDSEKVCFDLAKINLTRGEYDTAEQYCQRCIRLNDEVDYAYELLADIELARGRDWERILTHRARVLALTPDSAASHIELAMALANLDRTDGARTHLKRAMELYPESMRLIEDHPSYKPTEIAILLELAAPGKGGKNARQSGKGP